jgi:hypothetical protein
VLLIGQITDFGMFGLRGQFSKQETCASFINRVSTYMKRTVYPGSNHCFPQLQKCSVSTPPSTMGIFLIPGCKIDVKYSKPPSDSLSLDSTQ